MGIQRRKATLLAVAFALVVAGPRSAHALVIQIQNSGFEADKIGTDGGYISGAVSEWNAPVAGVFNPTSDHFDNQAPEGNNTGYINPGKGSFQDAGLGQWLSGPDGNNMTKPGRAYTLTLDIGDRRDTEILPFSVDFLVKETNGYSVLNSLTYDDVMAQGIEIPDGGFATVSFETLMPTNSPHVGKQIGIRVMGGADPNPDNGVSAQVNIDNISLTNSIVAVPEPATVALVLIGIAGLIAAARRRSTA